MKTKAFASDIKVAEGERAVSAVISTAAVDRDGEVLQPMGCNSKDYEKNPIIFFNHAYADPMADPKERMPVGRCEALVRGERDIRCKIVFASRPETHPADEEWLPDTLLSLYQQGVMRSFSVGFIPTESRPATQKDLDNFGKDCRGVVSKWKLLEVSCVPLPANQEAVALAVSKGLVSRERATEIFGKAAEETPAPVVEEQQDIEPVVRVVTAPAEPQPEMIIVTRTIEESAPVATVRTLVMKTIAKARGRIYFD